MPTHSLSLSLSLSLSYTQAPPTLPTIFIILLFLLVTYMQVEMAANSSRDAMLHQMALPYHHAHHHHHHTHHHHHAHHTDFVTAGDNYHLNSSPSSSSMAVDHTHHHHHQHALGTGDSYRHPSSAPLRKLTVDLIKTYRKINDVSEVERKGGDMCVHVHTCRVVCKRECEREREREI